MRLTRSLTTFVTALSLLSGAVVGTAPAAQAAELTPLEALRLLPVAPASHQSTFDRHRVKYWLDADKDCRSTRHEVLAQENRTVSTGCVIRTGQWRSAYDGRLVTSSSALTISPRVSLAEAWRSGAWAWSAKKWLAFANDTAFGGTLVATTRQSAALRAGRDAGAWLPTVGRCAYVQAYINVKLRWKLSVDQVERDALQRAAQACTGTTSAPPAQPAVPDLIGFSTTTQATRFGAALDVDPNGKVAKQAASLRAAGQTAYADSAAYIAKRSIGNWYVTSKQNVEVDVARRTTEAASRKGIATLVLYNIPQRDPRSYAKGGAASADEYRDFIERFRRGLGNRRAIVIVEPDALTQLPYLSAADQQTRLSLLSYAVRRVQSQGSWAYLDAGNLWPNAEEQASRLRRAGVEYGEGFSLNTSNFENTDKLMARGQAISKLIPNAPHFVLDTGRNGMVDTKHEWCNMLPTALGADPTTRTGSTLADAFLWVKPPGDSDGPCNGGPSSGTFWPWYADQLVKNARS